MSNRPTDTQLLSSSAEDFGRFYERHLDSVVAYVGKRVREPDLVFDLVGETFARALERRDQFDPRRGAASAWLLAIARNLIIDAARHRVVASDARRRLGIAPVELDDDQLDRIRDRAGTDLESSLAGLPSAQREAVVRRFVLEQSYPEIAAELHCSEQVVRKRVSRGRAALRNRLESPE